MLRALIATLFLAAPAALAQGPDCANPEAIAGEGLHSFDLAGRVASGPVGNDICQVDLGPGIGDVFWQWTAAAAGHYRFEIQTPYHTSLVAYQGSGCGATLYGNKSGTTYSLIVPGRQTGDQVLLHLGETFANPDAVGTLNIVRFDDACSAAVDDALEDNDTYQTALALGPGSYDDLFLWRGDEDYYRVTVPGGNTLRVDWSAPTDEAVLRVMNDACGEFTYQLMGPWSWTNPGAGAVDLVLNFEMRLPAAECTTYGFGVEIGAAACLDGIGDGLEDNDTASEAAPLGSGLFAGLSVHSGDDDYYAVCVPPGQALHVEAQYPAALALLELGLLGPSGVQYSQVANALVADYMNTSALTEEVLLHVSVNAGLATCALYDLMIVGAGPCPGTTAGFCLPGGNNSTGGPTVLDAGFGTGLGSGLHLEATGGPGGEFGYFLVSQGVLEPGGVIGDGRLCLTNPVGRYNGSSGGPVTASLGAFDSAGRFTNLSSTSSVGTGFDVPSFVPLIASTIAPGQTWHFQLWHRDANPGPTVNFSGGLSVTF